MKRARGFISTHPVVRFAMTCVAAMTLVFSAASRASDAAAASDATTATRPAAPVPEASVVPTPDAAVPRFGHHRPVRHLTIAQSIDENVRRLTRGLNLDPSQQEKLRQILLDQHRQMMQLRTGGAAGSGDVTGRTMAIYAQTKGRIRAMLNDQQKTKYSADVPRDTLAPAQADLQHWMQIQESSRKQGDGDSQ